MKKPKETITLIIGCLTILGILFGAYRYLDTRYALAEEVKKIEKRLDYKILADQLMAIQERLWKMQDRYPAGNVPETVKEEQRKLEMDKKVTEEKLQNLQK